MKKLLTILLILASSLVHAQTRPDWIDVKNKPDFDVRAYGAKPGDSADDSTAIQAAVNAAVTAGGGRVIFGSGGIYNVAKAIVVPYGNRHLTIDGGSLHTRLQCTTATSAIILQCNVPLGGYSGRCLDVLIQNLEVYGDITDEAPLAATGIDVRGGGGVYLDNLRVFGFATGVRLDGSEIDISRSTVGNCDTGIKVTDAFGADGLVSIRSCWIAGNYDHQILTENTREVRITDCNIVAVATSDTAGIVVSGNDPAKVMNVLSVERCFFESGNATNPQVLLAHPVYNARFSGCNFNETGGTGTTHRIQIASGAHEVTFDNCYAYNADKSNIWIKSTQDSKLRINITGMSGGGAPAVWTLVTDDRPIFHMNTFADTWGPPVNANRFFIKSYSGWAFQNTLTYPASSTFVATDCVQLVQTATSTATWAEWFPDTNDWGHYDNDIVFIDAIIQTTNAYDARLGIVPFICRSDGTNATDSVSLSNWLVQTIDGQHRVFFSFVMPQGYRLYSIRFGNPGGLTGAYAAERRLLYMAIHSKLMRPQDKLYWYNPSAAPTDGAWLNYDSVYFRGDEGVPSAGKMGFTYIASTSTWVDF